MRRSSSESTSLMRQSSIIVASRIGTCTLISSHLSFPASDDRRKICYVTCVALKVLAQLSILGGELLTQLRQFIFEFFAKLIAQRDEVFDILINCFDVLIDHLFVRVIDLDMFIDPAIDLASYLT